ncbi:Protein of unknown function [Cohaesibacter sp. ES.047]|uniref:DUF2865 domain-containing protein n=1 Tax=Cohaesibacter sp. ES.047 TaxID=1798205 RepID=UPI000BB7E4FC|nr:DUF2865 domain-containing protein [Cohaesibacter sp. ES.047]SNY93865.1 Protein of unknown function [Cohaesibacter sp. ES.047]
MTFRAPFAGLILAALVSPIAAEAQTSWSDNARYCAQLEGELAKLQRAGNSRSNVNFQKYDAAIHKQQAEIDNANQRAKRDACFGSRGFLFRRSPKASCPALIKRIDKMKRNLASLEKKRSRYAPAPQNAAPLKASILRQLAESDCGQQYERFASVRPVRKRRGLFGAIFQPRSAVVREYNGLYDIPQVGTYRTVCVRKCDGFFFPVSFSTTESSFARDEGKCAASCPGSEAELFVYKNPGENPEDMVSLSGQPYQTLDTAFLYKKEFVNNCSCQLPESQLQSITDLDKPRNSPGALDQQALLDQLQFDGRKAPASTSTAPGIPLPLPKQASMIDPDTKAMARLGIDFAPYQPPQVSSAKGLVKTADGRSIRIVGPKFFGNQE